MGNESSENIGKSCISGCTILRNGVKLGYPFEESVASYAPICDEIVICWDPTSEDDTRLLVERVARRFPQVRLVESAWDMSNRVAGTELARQTQIAFDHCRRPWTLYVQADEALHEDHFEWLQSCSRNPELSGVAFRRLAFLRTLDREIPAQRAEGMVRMFRTGLGRSVGDAMFVQLSEPGSVVNGPAMLFNYSRLGTDEEVRLRSDNLNAFYHDDAYIAGLDPDRNRHWETVRFTGTHPAPMERARSHGAPVAKPDARRTVLFSVDDIRPEPGFGLELDSGPIAIFRDLHGEFGCRFTLFMPTNYYGRADLRDHREWFKSLQDMGIFEIASHGHHHWNLIPGRGDMEYLTDSIDEINASIARSMETFKALGYRPRGAKPPGWEYIPEALGEFASSFDYLADHVVGTDWLPSRIPDLPLLPYTRCIHERMEDLLDSPGPLFVLHSHFSGEGGKHDNGWDANNLKNVREFLRKLTESRGAPVTFATASETLPPSPPRRSKTLLGKGVSSCA